MSTEPSENEESHAEEVIAASSASEKITETEETPVKRSRLPFYIVSAIVFVILTLGVTWWVYARRFEKTDDAFIEGNISLISPKISSHVDKIHVEENQFVKKGDLLIEFDDREAEAKL